MLKAMILVAINEEKTIMKLLQPPAACQPGDLIFLEVVFSVFSVFSMRSSLTSTLHIEKETELRHEFS
jgi:hypothetical protein